MKSEKAVKRLFDSDSASTDVNQSNTSKGIYTPETNIDPDDGPLEECFPLPTTGFQGPF